MANTATSPTLEAVDESALRIEAAVVLRTVDHITEDLDIFSSAIRSGHRTEIVIDAVEHHLALARRNCADASAMATEICEFPGPLSHLHADMLRDAFACLALADAAYLHAFETAGPA